MSVEKICHVALHLGHGIGVALDGYGFGFGGCQKSGRRRLNSALRSIDFFPEFLGVVPFVHLSVRLGACSVLVRFRKSPLMRARLLLASLLLLGVLFLAVSLDSSSIYWNRAFLWNTARFSAVEARIIRRDKGAFSLFGRET